MEDNIMLCMDNLEDDIKKLNFFVDKYFSQKLENLNKELQRLRSLFETLDIPQAGFERMKSMD